MKIETLKTLIELIPSNSNDGDFVKEHVLKYIDLFEKDQELKQQFLNYPLGVRGFDPTEPLEVSYGDVCSCNPKNGGSGICGCTVSNTMIRNPKSIPARSLPSFPPQDYGLNR